MMTVRYFTMDSPEGREWINFVLRLFNSNTPEEIADIRLHYIQPPIGGCMSMSRKQTTVHIYLNIDYHHPSIDQIIKIRVAATDYEEAKQMAAIVKLSV